MRGLEVRAVRFAGSVQDAGRPGWASIGVGRSGAADRASLALANRLLGNAPEAAGLELVLGGLEVVARGGDVAVAVTGARCPCDVDGVPVGQDAPVRLTDGRRLRIGTAERGLRAYLALRGGIDVPPVLGSRSTDALAGVGPEPLAAGTHLPAGDLAGAWPGVDAAPGPGPAAGDVRLRVLPGPREDRFTARALADLVRTPWTVAGESDRVGLRLDGVPLPRSADGDDELPSEGTVPGALQVPPEGRPVLFLADHPLTGGYPVIAVVADADLDAAAQARPGQRLLLRRA